MLYLHCTLANLLMTSFLFANLLKFLFTIFNLWYIMGEKAVIIYDYR